jgi:hypothetical protein
MPQVVKSGCMKDRSYIKSQGREGEKITANSAISIEIKKLWRINASTNFFQKITRSEL